MINHCTAVMLAIAGGTCVIILLFIALCVTSCATLCLVFRHRYKLFLARQHLHQQQQQQQEEKDEETADVYVQRHLQIKRCAKSPRNNSSLSFSFSDRISVYKHHAPHATNSKLHHANVNDNEDYDYVISSPNRRVSTSKSAKSDNSKRSRQNSNNAVLKQTNSPSGFNNYATNNNQSKCFVISSSVPNNQRFIVSPSFLCNLTPSSTNQQGLLSASDNRSSSALRSTSCVSEKLEQPTATDQNDENGRENAGFLSDDNDSKKSRNVNDDFYWMPTMSELSVRVRSCPDSPCRLLVGQGRGRYRSLTSSSKIIGQSRSETVLDVEPLKVLRTFCPQTPPPHQCEIDIDTISHASYCYIDSSRDSDTDQSG